MKIKSKTNFFLWQLGLIVLTVDQISKALARKFTEAILNTNLALNWPLSLDLLFFSCLILFFIGWLGRQRTFSKWGRGLMIGGALSNLIDRWFFNGVWDWLSMPFVGGLNNLADWSIILGLLTILGVESKKRKVCYANIV